MENAVDRIGGGEALVVPDKGVDYRFRDSALQTLNRKRRSQHQQIPTHILRYQVDSFLYPEICLFPFSSFSIRSVTSNPLILTFPSVTSNGCNPQDG